MMKKLLFCLSLGLVAAGCQNGTLVPEGDVRTNFSSYCKLTGGTPQGANVCICGNYRCYERACNHDASQCDDRTCYNGDTKCTNSDDKTIGGKIQICSDRQWIDYDQNKNTINSGNAAIENVNSEGYCASNNANSAINLSCAISEHNWEAKCGECLNGDHKCAGVENQNEAGLKYYLYQCESGKYQNVAVCKNGCRKDGTDCQSCEAYCVNDTQTTIGKEHRCDSTDTINCPNNASCTYNNGISECGSCRNITCENIPDTPYFISVKRCENGKPIESVELATHLIYSDKDCSQTVNNNLCLRLKVTDSSISKDSVMFYNCNDKTSCFLSGCEHDCSVEEGCLEENAKGECNDGNDQSNCQNTNSCFCNNENNDCSHCINCKEEDGNHCICSDNHCVQVPKCDKESTICPANNFCSSVGTCVSDCNEAGLCNTVDCNKLQCVINEKKATVYCDISKANLDYSDPSIYPFILIDANGSELHIDSKNIDLLNALSELDQQCTTINTIVLHGERDGKFEINCGEDFTSISLPENITKIRGALNEGNSYPIIQCNSNTKNNYLKKPLFKELNAITLENFGIYLNFDLSIIKENTGGFAKTIKDSALINISITGEITCSQADNCGLLTGILEYTDDYSGPEIELSGTSNFKEKVPIDYSDITPIIVTAQKNNVGGLVGTLILNSTKDINIKFNRFDIKRVNGTIDNIAGSNNVGGIIGVIDSKNSKGTTSIDFSDIRMGDASQSEQSIVILGTNNVGGFIGSIGCEDKDKCTEATPNIIIKGSNNTLSGTVNGMNNVGGVIGAASGLLAFEKFKLNDFKDKDGNDSNENLKGRIIGGTSQNNDYNSENIGGLIGKLVSLKDRNININNTAIKLDKIACAEYEKRLAECLREKKCLPNGLCTKFIQCSKGGGIIGWLDIAENSTLNLQNLYLTTNTLAISRKSAGLVGYIGTQIGSQEEHKFGEITISDVLIVIPKVDGRLDLFGRFRGVANNIRVLTKLSLSNLIAVIKLNDNVDLNYCLYKNEYEQPESKENPPNPDRRPCHIPSPKTDNAICNSNSDNNPGDKILTCSECLSEYINHYPYFLLYAPECRYTESLGEQTKKNTGYCYIDGEYDFTKGEKPETNKIDLAPNLDIDKVKTQSVYFYQFANYSTYHRPLFIDIDDQNKIKMHFEVMYGQCFTNTDATSKTICTYLQNDCNIDSNGLATTLKNGVSLYCCDSPTDKGGQCKSDQKLNNKYVCVDEIGATHNQSTMNCTKFDKLINDHQASPDTFFKDWNFDNLSKISVEDSQSPGGKLTVHFPTPNIDLN